MQAVKALACLPIREGSLEPPLLDNVFVWFEVLRPSQQLHRQDSETSMDSSQLCPFSKWQLLLKERRSSSDKAYIFPSWHDYKT